MIFCSIVIVLLQIVSLKAGYEVDLLQKRLDALAKERQELLLKLGELTSSDKIKKYAKSNGFIFYDKGKVVYLDIRKEIFTKAWASDSM